MKETKTIEALIEVGSDGLYTVRMEEQIDNCLIAGYGQCEAEAKEDFLECLSEMLGTSDLSGLDISYRMGDKDLMN